MESLYAEAFLLRLVFGRFGSFHCGGGHFVCFVCGLLRWLRSRRRYVEFLSSLWGCFGDRKVWFSPSSGTVWFFTGVGDLWFCWRVSATFCEDLDEFLRVDGVSRETRLGGWGVLGWDQNVQQWVLLPAGGEGMPAWRWFCTRCRSVIVMLDRSMWL